MMATQGRYVDQIKLRFRKMNPQLGLSQEQVLIELFDVLNEELYALYLPYQNFRYGDFLYFALASTDYLNHGPLPLFLKMECRLESYENQHLIFTRGTRQNLSQYPGTPGPQLYF